MSSLSKKKSTQKITNKSKQKKQNQPINQTKKKPTKIKKKKRNKGWNQFLFKEVKVQ